jgi:hypothetical protein
LAELWLANKAAVNATENKGETLSYIAALKDRKDAEKVLRQHNGHE